MGVNGSDEGFCLSEIVVAEMSDDQGIEVPVEFAILQCLLPATVIHHSILICSSCKKNPNVSKFETLKSNLCSVFDP